MKRILSKGEWIWIMWLRWITFQKTFNGIQVLKDINLNINKGSTIGIIGSNGSGKSVLFKLICGFTKADNGEITIRGEKLGKDFDFPRDVGVLINKPGYISIYSGFKNLQFLARINNKIDDNEIVKTMKLVGLDPNDELKVKNYSMGMKQKLGIAQAIMEHQDVIILDEPFNALDYKTYKDIKNIIRALQKKNNTILLTSHNYKDIEELCDEVYVISDCCVEALNEEHRELYT